MGGHGQARSGRFARSCHELMMSNKKADATRPGSPAGRSAFIIHWFFSLVRVRTTYVSAGFVRQYRVSGRKERRQLWQMSNGETSPGAAAPLSPLLSFLSQFLLPSTVGFRAFRVQAWRIGGYSNTGLRLCDNFERQLIAT